MACLLLLCPVDAAPPSSPPGRSDHCAPHSPLTAKILHGASSNEHAPSPIQKLSFHNANGNGGATVAPVPQGAPLLNAEAPEKNSSAGSTAIIVLAVIALAVARSYRASRKYRGKYLKPNIRKRKTYTREYDEDKMQENRMDLDDED